ncbi:GP179 protein, partial [Crypturellus undulatus]|nr:GP179 protein [Crypturellus undulatus]
VFILYFKPSIFRCIVLRWVRVLGFAIVYGTVTLKLYRYRGAAGAGTGTVPRLPPRQRGCSLLRGSLSCGFPAGWGLRSLRLSRCKRGAVPRAGRSAPSRLHPGELLLLLWGSSLCVATRAVPSAFHEPRYLGIALHNELLVSAAFHRLAAPWVGLSHAIAHGDSERVANARRSRPPAPRCPQFLRAGSPLREEIAAEVYEDELDMRRSGSCMTSSIASAWSEHSLDPDDIRDELKKLYAQLEAQRARRMAACNPHLPR